MVGDVLRLTHLYTFGDVAVIDIAGMRLFLPPRDEDPEKPGESVIYCRVDDIQKTFQALTERGSPSLAHHI